MPLTTYAPGDVLTASSLNANLVFAAANPTGGLVRVGGGTLSGASTAFTNVFSATYEAYKIVFSNVAPSSTNDNYLNMILGSTITGYFYGYSRTDFITGVASGDSGGGSDTGFLRIGQGVTFGLIIDLQNPFLASKTSMQLQSASYNSVTTQKSLSGSGFLNNTTSYTGFTISIGTGTVTGTVNVYGYALS